MYVLQAVCFFMDSMMALCYESESHILMLASFPSQFQLGENCMHSL